MPGLTHRPNILSALCVFYAGGLVSPYVQIFYPDFESFTPGFLLHPSSKYFIRTLSLLRRGPGLTLHSDFLPRISECVPGDFFLDGCLVSPIVQIFYPHFESFTPDAWSHPTFRYFIQTLSLLRRVPGLTLRSSILSRL